MASWVDSHRSLLRVSGNFFTDQHFRLDLFHPGEFDLYEFTSVDGSDHPPKQFTFSYVVTEENVKLVRDGLALDPYAPPRPRTFLGFYMGRSQEGFLKLLIPHWFPVLSSGLLAVLLRPKPRWQFGLRDLFAITTIVAAVVGGFAVLHRLAKN